MANIQESAVLLVGTAWAVDDRYNFEEKDGRNVRGDKRGVRVTVGGESPANNGRGVTIVNVENDDIAEAAPVQGSPVVWWVRPVPYTREGAGGGGGTGALSTRFVAAADENTPQMLHEFIQARGRAGARR